MKHDFLNHNILLYDLIKENNNEKALSYINDLLNKANKATIFDTGRADIDSILNFKYMKARQYNVKIESEIFIPIEMDIKDYDMVVILGNLLDNALKAVKGLPSEERSLKLRIRYDRLRLFIQTKNSGELIFDKTGNLQTTNQSSEGIHGIGITNIKKVVSRYNGYFTYEIESGTFKTFTMLYVNK